MNNDQLKVAIEALHTSIKYLYFDGVPTDKCHPRRIAADAVEEAIAALTAAQSAHERDWTEDFQHENGHYMCNCVKCGSQFFGHKRRVTCKACASIAKVEQEQKPIGWIKSAELEKARKFGGSVNLWLDCYCDTDKPLYDAAPQAQQDDLIQRYEDLKFRKRELETEVSDLRNTLKAMQAQQEAGKDALRKILVNILPEPMKEKHPFDFMLADECEREKHRAEVAGWNNCRKAVMDAADNAYRAAMQASPAQAATVQEWDNVLQELVDIAQENDMGYGAPAAQADTQQSKKGEGK